MLPKPMNQLGFLTVEQAEKIIDEAVVRANYKGPIHASLCPITEDALTRVCEKYAAGRWSVSADPMRMPHGYGITLR